MPTDAPNAAKAPDDAMQGATTVPGYYMLKEAAAALGYLSTGNLAGDCKAGRIPAYKAGPVWLIPAEWVEAHRQDAPANNRGHRGMPRK